MNTLFPCQLVAPVQVTFLVITYLLVVRAVFQGFSGPVRGNLELFPATPGREPLLHRRHLANALPNNTCHSAAQVGGKITEKVSEVAMAAWSTHTSHRNIMVRRTTLAVLAELCSAI